MSVRKYQDVVAWQKAIDLVTAIYRATQSFPSSETYGLTSQLRRAAVSIPSNIAEGQGRASTGEFRHFLGQARGSLLEVETQIVIAKNLDYLPEAASEGLLEKCAEVSKILYGLIAAIERKSTGH